MIVPAQERRGSHGRFRRIGIATPSIAERDSGSESLCITATPRPLPTSIRVPRPGTGDRGAASGLVSRDPLACTISCSEEPVDSKAEVKALLERLPDDCTIEDILYHLYVLQQVELGLSDVSAGRVVSHEDVKNELRRKWLLGAAG